MSPFRLRPRQWLLLQRLSAIDERLDTNAESEPIAVGLFNQGTMIVKPGVADPEIDEGDFVALDTAGLLDVVSRTSSLVRFRISQRAFDALAAEKSSEPQPVTSGQRAYQINPPPEVQAEAAKWMATGTQLQREAQPLLAFEAFRRAWEIKLQKQPSSRRFHKGAELAAMASASYQATMMREAVRWFLAAFLEDAISRAEDSPEIRDELHWPAAQGLRRLGLSEERLSTLSDHAREAAKLRPIQDPLTVFRDEGLDQLVSQVDEPGASVRMPQIRIFVSSPGDLRKERILVADVCQDLAAVLDRDIRALLWEGAGPRHREAPPFAAEITGLGPQAVIDNQIRDAIGGYDIYVGMIWKRMGTSTGDWRSGTEAEFRYALDGFQRERRPRKPFFYTKLIDRGQQRHAEAEDLVRELETTLGLPQRFRSVTDLRTLLIHDLMNEIRSIDSGRTAARRAHSG